MDVRAKQRLSYQRLSLNLAGSAAVSPHVISIVRQLRVVRHKETMQANLQEEIKFVVDCLIAKPRKNDEEITPILKPKGLDDSSIPAYLLWIPMAFCRFMLRGEIQFPEHFQSFDPETENKTRKAYSEHLLFQEATKYAEAAVSKGLRGDNFIAVAGRSAEFHVINQMELSGSKIENIVLSEAHIPKTAFDELQPEKKKRRFWR